MILYGSHVMMKTKRMALSVRAAFFSFAFFSFLRLLISVLALEAKRLAIAASFMVIAAGDWSAGDEVTGFDCEPFRLLEDDDPLSLLFFTFLDFLPSR